MEEIILFIESVNKFALLAFFLTFSLVIFEIYLFLKEKKIEQRPKIPSFNKKISVQVKTMMIKDKTIKKGNNMTKPDLKVLVFLVVMLIVISLIIFLTKKDLKKTSVSSEIILKLVNSEGILVFDDNWKLLSDQKIGEIKPNEKIFIGIKTIPNLKDIDKARIKINKEEWSKEDEVKMFNEKYGIFYREYQIATDEKKLTIEAQLHSKKEGWLEER